MNRRIFVFLFLFILKYNIIYIYIYTLLIKPTQQQKQQKIQIQIDYYKSIYVCFFILSNKCSLVYQLYYTSNVHIKGTGFYSLK
ncbi:hypothetical protein F4703DRAFT_1553715 [Phycomyces blakesleeanus]